MCIEGKEGKVSENARGADEKMAVKSRLCVTM